MALKGDRYVIETDVAFHLNEVAERGLVVVYSTSGSGVALDQSEALLTVAGDPSGKVPFGYLLGDMVNKDLTRTHINHHKDEAQLGGKVPVMRKGWLVTNKYVGSPTAGNIAYLLNSGIVTPTVGPGGGPAQTPVVGRFESKPDEDGYVKVAVNLP